MAVGLLEASSELGLDAVTEFQVTSAWNNLDTLCWLFSSCTLSGNPTFLYTVRSNFHTSIAGRVLA
jgi:hypothetical protein